MKKKILLTVLSLSCALTCAAGLSACDFGFGGSNDGENNLNNGNDDSDFRFELTENGRGLVLTNYLGSETQIVIPAEYNGAPVTEIDRAFSDNDTVTKITLPDSVTKIGAQAFANTPELAEVVFPNGLKEIGDLAFQSSGIRSATLPATVTSVGAQAFYKAKSLTEFKIAANAPVTVLKQSAVGECSALKTVVLSDNLKTIEYGAFAECGELTSIDLNHVETVFERAFENCTKLAEIDFGDSLKCVKGEAFENAAVASLIFPETCEELDSYAFSDCTNLKTVSIPENVKRLGNTFSGCPNVEKLTIPSGQITLNNLFLLDFADDYSISMPKLTELHLIGAAPVSDEYLSRFSKLKTITLDERVSDVGENSFANTEWYTDQSDGMVYIGSVCLGYKGEKPSGAQTVQAGTTGIAKSAFKDCTALTQISLPESIKHIGGNAFENCALTALPAFTENLTAIGDNAFSGCNITGEVTVPSSVTEIGINSFKGNAGISKLTLPMPGETTLKKLFSEIPAALTEVSVTGSSLPANALNGAKSVVKVTIPEQITEIPDYAFCRCEALITVIYGAITKIGDFAFLGCNAFTNFTVPDSVTEIGDSAFCNMSNLRTVKLGENVIEIGERSFSQNQALTSVTVNDKLERMGRFAFTNCRNLTSINFGKNLKIIEDYAFEDCYNLTEVQLNSGLQSIGNLAFSQTNLNKLVIPKSVTYVGSQILLNLKNSNLASFKLFAEAEEPNANWHENWNVLRIDIIEEEAIKNYYPTFYYSETEKTDEELQFWHYVNGVPTVWNN